MSPLDRIRRQHVSIMHHKMWCSFGPILASGRTEVREDIPTACTDGLNKFYGESFIEKLSDPELRFVILHEATHVAYLHLDMWRGLFDENPKLANQAADYFVNISLLDADKDAGFIRMPQIGGMLDEKYRGWSVRQIYDDLKKNGGSGSGGGGFDEHMWDEAHGRSAEEREKLAEEIQRLVRQGEIVKRQRSKDGAGSQDGVFGALLEAKINWREVLRDFVSELCAGKDESSWRKPNRRYLSDDVYMPTLQGVTMGELVVALDTSGSCFGSAMMTAFVSELQGVIEQVRPSRVRVLYWDTRVAGDQVFDDGHFAVATLKPKGGGGTRADVVFDYLRDNRIKPEAVIVLTDGEIGNSWGKSDWPTLWAIAGKRKAPFGTTIRVEV